MSSVTSRPKPKDPYALVDGRQREAAAILMGAIDLPAEMFAVSQLWIAAAKLSPGLTVEGARLGDRRAGLERARDLVTATLADLDSQPSDGSSPKTDPSHDR